ncbi:pollen-specific leucine-rich repeat extensin-like protein 4 [Iris pallida]|uniref:Pollen-specific leucine-rich repeat extensin-like protein 4 n=1 Tax=Iris pallida TaxID=29817 RepID=A0AAX6H0U3_IRIPA|nr:pollen-specific leucine-rich repeat extensin-like protein 4 [Iris pallida]KAJ6834576.1 pollen-specific leucine-rich repeat extensin-like protein 4 [Iris pallida]
MRPAARRRPSPSFVCTRGPRRLSDARPWPSLWPSRARDTHPAPRQIRSAPPSFPAMPAERQPLCRLRLPLILSTNLIPLPPHGPSPPGPRRVAPPPPLGLPPFA